MSNDRFAQAIKHRVIDNASTTALLKTAQLSRIMDFLWKRVNHPPTKDVEFVENLWEDFCESPLLGAQGVTYSWLAMLVTHLIVSVLFFII